MGVRRAEGRVEAPHRREALGVEHVHDAPDRRPGDVVRLGLDAARAVVFDVASGVAARLSTEQVVEEVAARARASRDRAVEVLRFEPHGFMNGEENNKQRQELDEPHEEIQEFAHQLAKRERCGELVLFSRGKFESISTQEKRTINSISEFKKEIPYY